MAGNEPISSKPILSALTAAAIFYVVEGGVGYQISKADLQTALETAVEFPKLHVAHSPASGVDEGAPSAGTFLKRTLDTEFANTITGASLAASVVTLPAGTYELTARAPAADCARHKCRWRNTTDGTTTIIGSSAYSSDADLVITNSVILRRRFTIATSKDFELQHHVALANVTFGFGIEASVGEAELFAEVFIEKVA